MNTKQLQTYLLSTALLATFVSAQSIQADEVTATEVETPVTTVVENTTQVNHDVSSNEVVQAVDTVEQVLETTTVQETPQLVHEIEIEDEEPVIVNRATTKTAKKLVGTNKTTALQATKEKAETNSVKVEAKTVETYQDETTPTAGNDLKFQEILELVQSGEIVPDLDLNLEGDEGTILFAKANIPSSGTYKFTEVSGIKAEPKKSSADLAQYGIGQTVNYDSVLEADGYQWISYISYSGARRYIAINALTNSQTTAASNNNDAPKTTTTVKATASGLSISATTNQVQDKTKILFAVWSHVNDQDDLKWYSANSKGQYVAKFSDHSGTGIYHIHTYTAESGEMVALHTTTINVTQAMIDRASQTTSNTTTAKTQVVTIPSSGTYKFTSRIGIKNEPKLASTDLAYYDAGMTVNYDSVVTNEGKQWISYISYSGARRYIAVADAGTTATPSAQTTTTKPTTTTTTITTTESGRIYSNVTPKITANIQDKQWCTWGAKEAAPWASNYWGNANEWPDKAAREGYKVGTTPAKGAIIVWQHGGYTGAAYTAGHVGVVKEVNSDGTLVVLESNYNNNKNLGNYRGNYNPSTQRYGGWVKYIYPPKGY